MSIDKNQEEGSLTEWNLVPWLGNWASGGLALSLVAVEYPTEVANTALLLIAGMLAYLILYVVIEHG